MTETYFLGANTGNGFCSLYSQFPPGERTFLHIIKGGPGTGKSSFMRAIGKAAEERGLVVHYVLCSGDPDSLDGVCLPSLGLAWADGTAPHVIEPRHFGVDSDYLNLGAFLRQDLYETEKEQIRALTLGYRAKYKEVYAALAHCAKYCEDGTSEPRRTEAPDLQMLPRKKDGPGQRHRRFLSAITWKGLIRLTQTAESAAVKLCARGDLPGLIQGAADRGWETVACPDPLDPREDEAVLLPEAGIMYAAFRSFPPASDGAFSRAVDGLREAKLIHDELESVYKEHMNFQALTQYTEETLKRLFP